VAVYQICHLCVENYIFFEQKGHFRVVLGAVPWWVENIGRYHFRLREEYERESIKKRWSEIKMNKYKY
jgi:hypothetical protein